MANITKEKRNWMIGSGIIIALFIGFSGAIYWLFFYTGSTKEIVAVADQLQVDPSWELDMEAIEPARAICINDECPSVSRNWKVNSLLTREDLESILEKSKWGLKIEEDCKPHTQLTQLPSGRCKAQGIIDNYTTGVDIASLDYPNNTTYVRLTVKETDKE